MTTIICTHPGCRKKINTTTLNPKKLRQTQFTITIKCPHCNNIFTNYTKRR